jgi:hypothetical protein
VTDPIDWRTLHIIDAEDDDDPDGSHDDCIVISIGRGRTLDVDVPVGTIVEQHTFGEQIIIRLKDQP